MEIRKSLLYFFLLAVQQVYSKGSLPKYYMSELCGQTLRLSSQQVPAGRVELVRRGDYRDDMDCIWTVLAPPEHYLMVVFKDVDIDKRLFRCDDYLQIYDNDKPSGNFLKGVSKLCGESHPRYPIYTTQNAMTLRFVSDRKHDDDGFDLYFNAYHQGRCNNSNEFTCKNGHCIDEVLRCNGYNNCGDNSDSCITETSSMIGIIIAVIMVVAVIAIVVFLCRRKRQQRERNLKADNDVPMATTFPQSQPPQGYPTEGLSYPPQGQGYPPQGQGYPPQGQGYPPQGQGYPPQGQGYPPQGQGYPPQGQFYPPQGQGYPPQGQGPPAYYGYGNPGGDGGYPQGAQYPQPGQYPSQYPPPQGPEGNIPPGAPPPYPGPPKDEFSKVPL